MRAKKKWLYRQENGAKSLRIVATLNGRRAFTLRRAVRSLTTLSRAVSRLAKFAKRHASGTRSRLGRVVIQRCNGPTGLVELRGIEPLTSAVRLQRSPI
jgi:hypothetical protein